MLPSLLAREVVHGLASFIITGFETPTPFFEGVFTRFVETPGNLYKGPYLSISLPFRTGTTGRDFFEGFATEHPPYVHQEQAWARLRSSAGARHTIVATGTGSGKTECFLYPLLDHCQQNSGPGIKAIIIYPMNALANDQGKRFAAAIHSAPGLRGKVRVGLFIGQGEHTPQKSMGPESVITDKDTLREAPPDILLTNYKMLDYLLIRPKDRRLWRFNEPETLRYLIVDELHTFDGAQGTDLACLLRRLRARLRTPANHTVCIGTSATLGGAGEAEGLVEYAGRIFQADFDAESVIHESRQNKDEFLGEELIEYQLLPAPDLAERIDPDRYDSMAAYIAHQYAMLFGAEPPENPEDPAWRGELGSALKRHLLFHNLLRLLENQPRGLGEVVGELEKTLPRGAAREHAREILNSLAALIAWARDPEHGGLPLVQLRLQLWVRELRRMVSRLQPFEPEADENHKPQLSFADDVKKVHGELYLPLVQCTECHATAWAALRPAGQTQLQADLRAIYNAFFGHSPELALLFPLLADEPPPEAKGISQVACCGCGHTQGGGEVCQSCGDNALVRVFVPDNNRQRTRDGVNFLVNDHHCPMCGARHSIMVFGSRAASLGSIAIHHQFASFYNDDKKLITFSDSVQDAAHRAGFFGARTWQNNVRMAIVQALESADSGRMSLLDFYEFVSRYWRDKDISVQLYYGCN